VGKFWDGEALCWEVGSQVCSMLADHEKHHQALDLLKVSRYRIEYFRGKKERSLEGAATT
jgi:hypothetical protein